MNISQHFVFFQWVPSSRALAGESGNVLMAGETEIRGGNPRKLGGVHANPAKTGPAPGIQTQHLLALTQRQPLFHFAAGLGHSVYLWKRNGFDWQLTSTLLFFAAK